MTDRSSRREVRNPVLALPETREIIDLLRDNPELQRRFGKLLRRLAARSAGDGEHHWRRGKAMMGAYWRVVAVYAKHLAHAIDPIALRGAAVNPEKDAA